ncbi:hypothetical protein OGV43_05595 [Citrobacter sp. Cb003]|uniref:hypothetical protein n=1 Tax=Citrobacter sp. Cb003 TaxID=2985005 RepID=UPI00258107A2|nr:hypothetical protein [Citrobacter sp. Cb003]MDM3379295.1 hypothetical protein [Citrobacter sp. Cb003]
MRLSGYIAVAIVTLGLMGCAVKRPVSLVSAPQKIASPMSNAEGEVDMVQCEKELGALESVDPQIYANLKARFERVMQGASGYSDVRNVINPETRTAIDALYKFQAGSICTEIRAEMLRGLAAKPVGEIQG